MDLYLFDIDGTLVSMMELHVKAYQEAYMEILNLSVPEKSLLPKFGKSEKQFNMALFEEFNISDEEKMHDIIELYKSKLKKVIAKTNIKVLPGVKEFLSFLKEKKELVGVVTGNEKEMGEAILKKADLLEFFTVFGYADNVETREDIVKEAIKQAKKKRKIKKIIVIGDSPADIEAGKAAKAFTVAVATGHYRKGQLKSADLVLENLTKYNKILDAVK